MARHCTSYIGPATFAFYSYGKAQMPRHIAGPAEIAQREVHKAIRAVEQVQAQIDSIRLAAPPKKPSGLLRGGPSAADNLRYRARIAARIRPHLPALRTARRALRQAEAALNAA